MAALATLIEQMRGRRVVVIGDVMIDEYLYGDVSRISPEAPVPIVEVRNEESRLGGAGNAAANVQSLGGVTHLIGVVGADATARVLARLLTERGVESTLVADPARPTSKKVRLVAQAQQIVRIDHERRRAVEGDVVAGLRAAITAAIAGAHAVVLSDYNKGVITPELAAFAIAAARAAGIPVIVDPKRRDVEVYRGATVITPNLAELDAAAGGATDVADAATRVLARLDGAALLVTRSADGMTLFRTGRPPHHVAALAKEVFDVTGAGDTVVATVALTLAAGGGLEDAIVLASAAAAIAVSRRGTATVSGDELLAGLASG